MLQPQEIVVVCDQCGREARFAGIDGSLGELVNGLRDEGWLLGEIDRCPVHQLQTEDRDCSVSWCRVTEAGHTWHQGDHSLVQADIAAGQDAPEEEGRLVHVGIEGNSDRARLGIAITGWRSSPTIRLTADATDWVRNALAHHGC